MLTLEKCREILNNPSLTDQEIEQIKGLLYALCESVLNYKK
jgi:hypothetical protein